MRLLAEYLRHAEECRKLAALADHPEQRRAIEKICETWDNLAAARRAFLKLKPGEEPRVV